MEKKERQRVGQSPRGHERRASRHVVAAAVAGMYVAAPALAFEIATGSDEIAMRWDTTVKYSNAFRMESASPVLLANVNGDDGDRNFGKGLISNRLDVLSEFDASYRNAFGVRFSGAAWYDAVYNRSNDNPGPAGGAAPNQTEPFNQFTAVTRELHGRKAELLDAFVFGKFDVGDSRGSFRLGQHTVLWGESLFFGGNSIASGQAPVDVIKAMSVPNAQFKEFLLPVPQVSGQLQVNPQLSIGAYYQFQFKPLRLPEAGSYFSTGDLVQNAAQRLIVGPGLFAPRVGDQRPGNSGQGGVQLRYRLAGNDFGLYAIRFHDKAPQVVTNIGPTGVDSFRLAYQKGIVALGASVSRTIGTANVAAEASIRHNQDLASQPLDVSALGLGAPTNVSGNPAYAVGRTAHINVSTLLSLDGTALWREASVLGEIAWNRVLSISKGSAAYDANASRDAVALRGVFEPTYRQVLSGLDISVPIGLGFSPKGSRSGALGPGAFPAAGGGDMSFGIGGVYQEKLRFSLSYTHFYGASAPVVVGAPPAYSYRQTLGDRDFLAASLSTTF